MFLDLLSILPGAMDQEANRIYEFGPFRVDPLRRVLLRDGQPLPIAAKTFATLLALIENRGHTVEKDRLMDHVWAGVAVEESNLTHHISALRKALGDSPDEHRYVITVSGHGYRFVAGVKELIAEDGIVVGRHSRSRIVIEEQETNGQTDTDVKIGPAKYMAAALRLLSGNKAAGIVILVVAAVTAAMAAFIVFNPQRYLNRGNALPKSATGALHIDKTKLTANIDARRAAISPDGKYVVYAVHHAGRESLWLRQAAIASSQQIIPPIEAQYSGLTFSPDGNYLYFIRWENEEPVRTLYRMPALGGSPQKLLADLEGLITFSPDGKRIAFVRNPQAQLESTLMIATADGTQQQIFAKHDLAKRFVSPSWSPDGKLIVCAVGTAHTGSSEMGLIELDAESGAERPVTSQKWEYIGQVGWLADRTGLVMIAREQGSMLSHIWHLSYPAAEARRTADDSSYYFLSLAADSNALATVQRAVISDIWILPNQDTSRAYQTAHAFDGLSWTPDGKIVYASLAGGNQDIWIMNADGSGQKQLTADAGKNANPVVTPDGRYIVFVSGRTGAFHIWRMNIDGTDPTQITNGGGENRPAVSRDGRWVVYTSVSDWTLWKIPIDGGEAVKLTDGYSSWPAISPDGKWIAYFRAEGSSKHQYKLAVIPFEGGGPAKVFDTVRIVLGSQRVQWTPDRQGLAYVVDDGDVSNIWIQPLAGGPSKQLTDFASDEIFNFAWSLDGKHLACERGAWRGDVVLIRNLR
jgi:Tol biopolymer transport system component/DNA-binding winged helix-turn-helix (wHTH) protein